MCCCADLQQCHWEAASETHDSLNQHPRRLRDDQELRKAVRLALVSYSSPERSRTWRTEQLHGRSVPASSDSRLEDIAASFLGCVPAPEQILRRMKKSHASMSMDFGPGSSLCSPRLPWTATVCSIVTPLLREKAAIHSSLPGPFARLEDKSLAAARCRHAVTTRNSGRTKPATIHASILKPSFR